MVSNICLDQQGYALAFDDFFTQIRRGFDLVPASHGALFVRAPQLEATGLVRHGSSTRKGGISKGCYETLNLSWDRTTSEEETRINVAIAATAMGIPVEDLVIVNGVHGTDIYFAKKEDRGNGFFCRYERREKTFDGLITNDPDVALNVIHADCTPVFYLDPVHKAIGLCHAGWRGTVDGIVGIMVDRMQKEFGTDPQKLIAAVGPNLSRKHFQVSKDVIDAIEQNFPPGMNFFEVDPSEIGKYKADLDRLAVFQLYEKGLRAENITVSDWCTFENEDLFYSYRRQGWEGGAMNSFFQLK
ncbi:peptidoglycan editing factor PgeF [Eubacteriales bacterium OttesenSCG-928-M02]|nr:peptidoglycan editing factor PgeF [Eubacteriales bacterium OttesenSCG-928-M02]